MKRILLTIGILILAAGAYAQISDNFELKKSVIDEGGLDQKTLSSEFELIQSSLGQTALGYSTSSNFSLYGGYLGALPPAREPGGILMDVKGLARDLTETGVQVDEITAVVNGEEFTAEDVPVTEGPATIHLIATDQFNQAIELDVNFTLDITPPTRPTLDAVETPTYVTPQTISGTKEANTSMRMFKDGGEFEITAPDSETIWSYPLDLTEGENIFQIFSKDAGGNESTRVSGNIYLDILHPEIAIVYPAHNTTVNQNVINVLGTVEDDQTTVKVSVNGTTKDAFVENRTFTAQVTLQPNPPNGLNVITAEAKGPGPLEFSANASVYYKPEANIPASPTINPVASPTNQDSQAISGTKPANTYLWLNNAMLGDGFLDKVTWSHTLVDLQERSNPLLLFVKDRTSPYPNVSGTAVDTIFYDSTAPTRALVIDDGFITNSKTSLHAKWVSDDPQTAIVDNQYAIGTTPGGQDTRAFTSVGTASEVTAQGLDLEQGKTYYFSVITTNAAGSPSDPGNSNGIRVNGSVPRITDVSLADLSKIYQGTSGINIAVTAEDKDADTLEYRFTIDGQIVQGWSTDFDYVWNVPADAFGRITILAEVKDVLDGQDIGGYAFKNIRTFVLKRPIDAP